MAGILPQHCLASQLSLIQQAESMKSQRFLKRAATACRAWRIFGYGGPCRHSRATQATKLVFVAAAARARFVSTGASSVRVAECHEIAINFEPRSASRLLHPEADRVSDIAPATSHRLGDLFPVHGSFNLRPVRELNLPLDVIRPVL